MKFKNASLLHAAHANLWRSSAVFAFNLGIIDRFHEATRHSDFFPACLSVNVSMFCIAFAEIYREQKCESDRAFGG